MLSSSPPATAASRLAARAAVVILAAAAPGVLEAAGALRHGAALVDAVVAGALAALLAAPAVVAVVMVAATAVRVPAVAAALERSTVQAWAARVWGAALAGVAAALLATLTFVAAKRVQVAFRFLDPAVAGLVLSAIVVAACGVLGAALWLVHRRLASPATLRIARWLGAASQAPVRRGAALAALALVAAVTPVAVAQVTVPALDMRPIASWAVVAVAAMWAAISPLGLHRSVRIGALALALALGAAPWAATRLAGARRAAVEHGALGKRGLRWLLALGDRDGDGHAALAFGGADCDDADGARHPLARERDGDRRDDNCNGAQAPRQVRAAVPARAGRQRPNVILISIDALRADHLGAWGYRRPVSPRLDELAARSARFSWAMTSCPSTRCAMPSMMTGRYAGALEPDPATLATTLAAAGWQTAAITCCERFTGAIEEAGFAVIDTSAHPSRLARLGQSNSDLVVDAAARWLGQRRAEAPFFLWLHLYDPHHPYLAPESPRQFGDTDLDRYDAEIRYADAQLGRLLDTLRAGGLAENTIVAVTADHGDEFGEHGIRFHARSLYHQVVRVPLLIYVPPVLGGRPAVVDQPVSLVDVMPTLLDLAGAQIPSGINGRSLGAVVLGEGPVPARPVLIELRPDHQIERNLVAVVWDKAKLIWDREANTWSLYSLEDARDEHELADRAPARVLALRRVLAETIDAELGIAPAAPH